LIAVIVVPLKSSEIVECGESLLTFAYRHTAFDIRSLKRNERMGTMKVTAAFGFAEHEPFLDPAGYLMTTPKIAAVTSMHPKIDVRPVGTVKPEPPKQAEIVRRPRRHHHHHRRRGRGYEWVTEAIKLGWKPPGTTDYEWRGKARVHGWTPPNEPGGLSIGAEGSANERGVRMVKWIALGPPV
jgi:hypothetical protein